MHQVNLIKEKGFSKAKIKTKRLLLRPARLADFDAINHYAQLPEVYRYIRPPDGDKHTHELVETLVKDWHFEEGVWQGLIITQPEKDIAIGEIVFRMEDDASRRIEIGYRLSPKYAGQGLITEAALAVINFLFEQFDIHKIVAKCDPRNTPSYKIMEKLGMNKEAHFKSHYLNGEELTDQLDYGILRDEWMIKKLPSGK